MTRPSWDQRIERARELAAACPFAAEVLLFYAKLTAFQKRVYSHLQSARGAAVRNTEATTPFASLRAGLPPEPDERAWAALLPMFQPFLALVAREGPAPLAAFAGDLSQRGSGACAGLLRSLWLGRGEVGAPPSLRSGQALVGARAPASYATSSQVAPAEQPARRACERFCAQAFLQPYTEFLAGHAQAPAPSLRRPLCPYCGSPPLVGVLRREGDGAKRSLVCSRCRTEWDYLRLACPACEEWREEKLCVYTAPQFEHVRVEACESCRTYLKTVDLTRNGLAIPEVDELAAVPLTLWADENGYQKLSRNTLDL